MKYFAYSEEKEKGGILMKKIVSILVLSLMLVGNTFAADAVKVNAFGKVLKSDAPILILDNVTYVPVRMISDGLGFNVSWDNKTQTITIEGKDIVDNSKVIVACKINSPQAKVTKNGETSNKPIGANESISAKLIEGSNFLPLRFIADQFGLQTTLRIDTIYLQKPGDQVPNEERVVYVYKRTTYGTQSVYSSKLSESMTPIRVKYGMHTYLSNNQEEYDYVMKVVEDMFEFKGNAGKAYKQTLEEWNDPKVRDWNRAMHKRQFGEISDEYLCELYKIESACWSARRHKGSATQPGVDSAYEMLTTGEGDCTADAMLSLAVLDVMGYNVKTVANDSQKHEWVAVQVNGEWLHIPGPALMKNQAYNRVTSRDTFNNAR